MEKPPWLLVLEDARRGIQQQQRIADDPGTRPPRPKEPVVNSPDIRWKPIDRTAAIVTSPALWIHKAPPEKKQITITKGKQNMRHERNNAPTESGNIPGVGEVVDFGGYQVKGRRINGELMFRPEDLNKVIMASAAELPKQTEPLLDKAKDARNSVNELLQGLGNDMSNFEDSCGRFLENIRQTRFSVVAETSLMSKSLREIRQFFIGSDYEKEINRLKDFVELCERLNSLKESGFLDKIADTMISLSA